MRNPPPRKESPTPAEPAPIADPIQTQRQTVARLEERLAVAKADIASRRAAYILAASAEALGEPSGEAARLQSEIATLQIVCDGLSEALRQEQARLDDLVRQARAAEDERAERERRARFEADVARYRELAANLRNRILRLSADLAVFMDLGSALLDQGGGAAFEAGRELFLGFRAELADWRPAGYFPVLVNPMRPPHTFSSGRTETR